MHFLKQPKTAASVSTFKGKLLDLQFCELMTVFTLTFLLKNLMESSTGMLFGLFIGKIKMTIFG